jgi:hypothetical protein
MSKNKISNLPWSLSEIRDNEFTVFLRFLDNVPDGIKISEYKYMISIFWSYPIHDKSGFPSDDIVEAHSNIEESLNALDDHNNSFYVAQITGNGRKEWIWYTNNIDKWWDNFTKLLSEHPKYPLDISVDEEPEWSRYMSISNKYITKPRRGVSTFKSS